MLDELGWTGGEAIVDCRTLVHYMRTTQDGRIAFGWGGGAHGARRPARRADSSVDPDVVGRTRESLVRFFPQLRGREITHAWGGPIDVSPTHLPIFGSRGPRPPRLRLHRQRRRAELPRRARSSRGWRSTGATSERSLALVEPEPKRFPPEPFRYAGGSLIRRALDRKGRRSRTTGGARSR